MNTIKGISGISGISGIIPGLTFGLVCSLALVGCKHSIGADNHFDHTGASNDSIDIYPELHSSYTK
ncbi:MAG: hypothetical protein KBB20_02290 [Bacteroidales bacterium]|jgi:hypothetical protein|nr:hypothetical protein [Bacteroidales bacterium]MBP8981707.1 hypothetical protein [Bacteroidales bacterium]NLV38207.1 hypothetical protein [Bacteroidales bacterium]HOH24002.1 hypothetical protein [Bacteroidales bacterium]HPB35437.1 hypothetical protein [Bacteroidales bacterium]